MKDNIKKLNKESLKKVSIIMFIVAIVLIVGGTLATFNFDTLFEGLSINKISTCKLSLNVKDDNPITLVEAYPISDEKAKEYTPYTFTITNKSDCDTAYYKITLGDICNTCSKTNNICTVNGQELNCSSNYRLNSFKVKYELVNKKTNEVVKDVNPENLELKGLIAKDEAINFELKLWIDSTATNEDLYVYENGKPKENSDGSIVTKNVGYKLNVEGQDSEFKSRSNPPLLTSNMIPVYYDESDSNWKKADNTNTDENYKWYDYDNKMWANAVTVAENSSYGTGEYLYEQIIATDSSVTLKTNVLEYSEKYTSGVVTFMRPTKYCVGSSYSFNKNTGEYIVNGTIMNGGSTFAGKYVCSTSCACTNMKYASSYIRQQTIGNGHSNIRYEYNGRSYSATPPIKEKYVATNFTFDKNTGQYTLTNPTLKVYSSSDVNYYTCDSETETTCSTMYKIKTVSTNTVTTADKYTSVGEEIKKSNSKLTLPDGSTKACTNNVCTREDYIDAPNGTVMPMTDINAMFVWIPRYKYTYFASNTPTSIPIRFENGIESTGTISCTDAISYNGTETGNISETCTDTTNGSITKGVSTYTHPAFTFGDEELTGIWVGKFETSATSIPTAKSTELRTAIIKPDVQSWRYTAISYFANSIRNMEFANNVYGFSQNGTTLNTYTGEISGDSNNLDTHMMKNMEWGAVAYLSHSKYGKNSEVYINNSSSYYTGRSGGNVGGLTPINETYTDQTSTDQYNSYGFYTYDGYLLNYNTNEKSITRDLSKVASTTGNIYGIYDMGGGAWEYVMGNEQGSSNSFYPSSAGTWSATDKPLDKYYDKYSYGDNILEYTRGKLGDAIIEMDPKPYVTWYSDIAGFLFSDSPWFGRGGGYLGMSSAGLFFFNEHGGDGTSTFGSRVVLSVAP